MNCSRPAGGLNRSPYQHLHGKQHQSDQRNQYAQDEKEGQDFEFSIGVGDGG